MEEPIPSNEPVVSEVADLREILERAQSGDVAAMPELREALRSRPDLVQYCGDLGVIAERAWVTLIAGQNLVLSESIKLRLVELKASLAGANPTPLERLAVERIAITWLQSGFADIAAAGPGDVSPRVAEFVIERQDRAQKRYLAALTAFTMIRKLAPDLGAAVRDGEHRRTRRLAENLEPRNGPESSLPDAVIRSLSIVSNDDQDLDDQEEWSRGPMGPIELRRSTV